MKKDNWRFEALARAKIVRQEEKAKTILLEAYKESKGLLKGLDRADKWKLDSIYDDICEAITKTEKR